MKKSTKMCVALMVLVSVVCSCKGKNAKEQETEASESVETVDTGHLSEYVKKYLSDNKPANETGDTSLEAIKATITDRVKTAVQAELAKNMADGYAEVDTQLAASGKDTYKGDVVVTYMTSSSYVSSQAKANVVVQVGRGFFSWQIEE